MGFNLGAFAGGLAQGGMSTYRMLEDIESQKKRDALIEMQTQDAKDERAGKAALRTAISETPTTNNTFAPNFGGTGGIDADTAPVPVKTTDSERMAGLTQRAIAAGADPMAVQKYQLGTYQLQNERRTSELNQKKFDLHQDREDKENKLQELVKANDAAGIVNYFGPLMAKETGHSYGIVNKPDGQVVEIRDDKGKLVESHKADAAYLAGKLSPAIDQHYISKWAALDPDFGLKVTANKVAERGVAVHEKDLAEKIKVGLFSAQAAQAKGAANASNAHASLYQNMVKVANSSMEGAEVMKPFLKEFSELDEKDQAGDKGRALLIQGATAAAKKSGDITGIINALKKPDRMAISHADLNKTVENLAGSTVINPDTGKKVSFSSLPPDEQYRLARTAIGGGTDEGGGGGINPGKDDKAKMDALKKDKGGAATGTTTTTPAAAIPTKATTTTIAPPKVDRKISYGTPRYSMKGLPGSYSSEEEAKKAWEKAHKSNLNFNDD